MDYELSEIGRAPAKSYDRFIGDVGGGTIVPPAQPRPLAIHPHGAFSMPDGRGIDLVLGRGAHGQLVRDVALTMAGGRIDELIDAIGELEGGEISHAAGVRLTMRKRSAILDGGEGPGGKQSHITQLDESSCVWNGEGLHLSPQDRSRFDVGGNALVVQSTGAHLWGAGKRLRGHAQFRGRGTAMPLGGGDWVSDDYEVELTDEADGVIELTGGEVKVQLSRRAKLRCQALASGRITSKISVAIQDDASLDAGTGCVVTVVGGAPHLVLRGTARLILVAGDPTIEFASDGVAVQDRRLAAARAR